MADEFSNFLKWAQNRFGEDNVLVKGKEIRINSVFTEDSNFHLWCSPQGGKKKRKFGVYHCFKTDKKGSLMKLIQTVDSCERSEAVSVLKGVMSIRELEKEIEYLLNKNEKVEKIEKKDFIEINLPEHSELISGLPTNNWWRKKATEYLEKRKIPIDNLYICIDGKYKSRIIIPYYDKDKRLIYWNARHMGKSNLKYLGPPKEIGVGKEDVIFFPNGYWPDKNEVIYICEGEFNAITLKLCELNSCACGGKNMSDKQAILLSDYKVVICLDRDKAGKQGMLKMTSMISSLETVKKSKEDKIKYVMPPLNYNDWNEMLINSSKELLYHYIMKNQKPLDFSLPYGSESLIQHIAK